MKSYRLFIFFLFVSTVLQAQPIKVMLITGGHSFDTVQFFEMFDAIETIEYKHFQQPKANAAIAAGRASDFDVLVFYDMWKTISEPEKAAYMKLTREGKPFLFLHHSLVSYQNWPGFEKIVGGRYIEKDSGVPAAEQSNYEHDVWVYIQSSPNHPVTRGMGSFRLFDEVYGNYRVGEKVIPLLTTNHPKSTETIGWENRCNSSRIIYLQPGHDQRTFETAEYRNLLQQAIHYLAAPQ